MEFTMTTKKKTTKVITLSDGQEITIRRTPPDTTIYFDILQSYGDREPKVPIVTVEIMGQETTEENPDDPDYKAELVQYHQFLAAKFVEVVLSLGVVLSDEQIEELRAYEQLRKKTLPKFSLDPDAQEYNYLSRVCMLTTDEIVENIVNEITALSTPTERLIKQKVDTFRT
jgi:hypothetical protein